MELASQSFAPKGPWLLKYQKEKERRKEGQKYIIQSDIETDFSGLQIKHKMFQVIYTIGGNSAANQWPIGH